MIKYITVFCHDGDNLYCYTPVYIYHAFIVNRGSVVNYKCKKKIKNSVKNALKTNQHSFSVETITYI